MEIRNRTGQDIPAGTPIYIDASDREPDEVLVADSFDGKCVIARYAPAGAALDETVTE